MMHALLLCTLAGCLTSAVPSYAPATATTAQSFQSDGGPVPLADSIVIEKKAHRLTLYHLGRPMRSYLVALGSPVGDKLAAGDRRTPEGVFSIEGRNPNSEYHLALRIAYPDSAHRARAQKRGVSPGGDIEIHGLVNGQGSRGAYHRTVDWTDGCIALTDEEMDEIWSAVQIGIPVEIKA